MAKDQIGNELDLNSLVLIELNSKNVRARVVSISEGGIALSPNQTTPGVCNMIAEFNFAFDPKNGIVPGVVRLVDPLPPQQVIATPDAVEPLGDKGAKGKKRDGIKILSH